MITVSPSRVGAGRVERRGLFLEICRRQNPQDTAGVLQGGKGEGPVGEDSKEDPVVMWGTEAE